MSDPLPIYPRPCLAADEDNNALFLLGVSTTGIGKMESSYINLGNVNSPSIKALGSQVDVDSWATNAPKACFTYPSDVHPNSPIMLVQYGPFKNFMSIMNAKGEFTNATYFAGIAFMSPRQFSMVGDSGDYAWFAALTNVTDPITKSNWSGVRLNFTSGIGDYIDTPLLSVGTYGSTPTTAWSGNNIVFDAQGGGYIYPSVGALDRVSHVITQSAAKLVVMNGISLTGDSVPVTMEGTAYILDKAADGSTALYSITPTQSTTLQRVTRTGGAPAFNPSMVAVAMNKLIVTYSMVNTTTAYLNTFDTTTNVWAGLGLVGVPSSSDNSGSNGKSAPLGAIIGGVVGGLVLIALVAFLFIRNKRRKAATAGKKDVDGHNGGRIGKAESNGDNQTPHVYTYVPEIVPVPIVQQPVFFDPNQQQQQVVPTNAVYYNPNAAPVYDQNAAAALNVYDPHANIYDQNSHVYDQGLNTYAAPGSGAYPPPLPQSAATSYSPVPPSPYQDPAMSPYSSQATKTGSPAPANPQFVEPELHTSPKAVGSPQYVDAREPYKVETRGGNEPEYYRP
ncbi:hypothetical protein BGZ96_009407 [Linnemannia gamsii]|uniref:Peptidase A1 domain-containing protein n=1 Tax=Linnemannia gamsii TaxID=64522 RepID=A0ABQ7KEA3_9FUNG|nr:hypothetical protein BGZ96_009407 [Linnemannia gamsii]